MQLLLWSGIGLKRTDNLDIKVFTLMGGKEVGATSWTHLRKCDFQLARVCSIQVNRGLKRPKGTLNRAASLPRSAWWLPPYLGLLYVFIFLIAFWLFVIDSHVPCFRRGHRETNEKVYSKIGERDPAYRRWRGTSPRILSHTRLCGSQERTATHSPRNTDWSPFSIHYERELERQSPTGSRTSPTATSPL